MGSRMLLPPSLRLGQTDYDFSLLTELVKPFNDLAH